MNLQGAVAIVTGASRGIGRATALTLAREGASVVLNARATGHRLDAVADEIRKGGGTATVAAGDVSDYETCGQIVGTALETYGSVHVLVNNAGIFGVKAFADLEPEDWESMFRVHVFGAFNMIRHVLPRMLESKRGVIVNVASFVALRPPGPGRVPYASAKAALFGLTRALGLEVASRGVRVVGVAPGLTDTELVRKGISDLPSRLSTVPLGRMAKPEEIAHTIRYLIENDFMTAETVVVAGGE